LFLVRVLLSLILVAFLELTFVMGDKMFVYLIHMTPLLAMLTAAVLASALSGGVWARVAVVGLASFLIIVQAGGVLLQISQNTYNNRYMPAVAAIRKFSSPGDLIMGSSAFFWTLRDERRLLDDLRLGYYSHAQPDLIVVGPFYDGIQKDAKGEIGAYFEHIFSMYSKILYQGEYVVRSRERFTQP
jgi:hypothetical protein